MWTQIVSIAHLIQGYVLGNELGELLRVARLTDGRYKQIIRHLVDFVLICKGFEVKKSPHETQAAKKIKTPDLPSFITIMERAWVVSAASITKSGPLIPRSVSMSLLFIYFLGFRENFQVVCELPKSNDKQ